MAERSQEFCAGATATDSATTVLSRCPTLSSNESVLQNSDTIPYYEDENSQDARELPPFLLREIHLLQAPEQDGERAENERSRRQADEEARREEEEGRGEERRALPERRDGRPRRHCRRARCLEPPEYAKESLLPKTEPESPGHRPKIEVMEAEEGTSCDNDEKTNEDSLIEPATPVHSTESGVVVTKKKRRKHKPLNHRKQHRVSLLATGDEASPSTSSDQIHHEEEPISEEARRELIRHRLGENATDERLDTYADIEKALEVSRYSHKVSLKEIMLGGRWKVPSLSQQVLTHLRCPLTQVETHYTSRYPSEYNSFGMLWICDGCFGCYGSMEAWQRHAKRCPTFLYPPGDEIYRDSKVQISVFKVHGNAEPWYCKSLCQLSMLWLKDKVVYELLAVGDFDFYVLTERMPGFGCRPVGYFSRERNSKLAQNLSCFCVFPCFQQMGYGRFLVDLSYTISRLEGLPGGPERPLSSSGLVTYTSYWKRTILLYLDQLRNKRGARVLQVQSLVDVTGMRAEDVIEVLKALFPSKKGRDADDLNLNPSALRSMATMEREADKKRLYVDVNGLEPEFKASLERRGRFNGVASPPTPSPPLPQHEKSMEL